MPTTGWRDRIIIDPGIPNDIGVWTARNFSILRLFCTMVLECKLDVRKAVCHTS